MRRLQWTKSRGHTVLKHTIWHAIRQRQMFKCDDQM